MSGLALKLQSYTAPAELNLPKFYPDAVMDESSVFVFDAMDTACWPSQGNTTNTSRLNNLVSGGAVGAFNFVSTFVENKGFTFTTNQSEQVVLPAAAKLTGYNGGFAAAVWISHETQTQSNNSVFGWYHPIGNGGYGLRCLNDASYVAVCDGKSFTLSPTAPDAIRQVVVARVIDENGNFFAAFYRNGIRLNLVATASTFVQPSTVPASVIAGDVALVSGGDSGRWSGKIGRTWFNKQTYTVDQMDALVARDWSMNSSRYT